MEVRNGKGSLTRLIAGIVITFSSVMVIVHHPAWALLTLIIGITHISSAVYGWCPMELFLTRVCGMRVHGKD